MTPARLAELGALLYGRQWQRSLARDLGVSERTVRRWFAGQFRVPARIEAELRGILAARRDRIDAALAPLQF